MERKRNDDQEPNEIFSLLGATGNDEIDDESMYWDLDEDGEVVERFPARIMGTEVCNMFVGDGNGGGEYKDVEVRIRDWGYSLYDEVDETTEIHFPCRSLRSSGHNCWSFDTSYILDLIIADYRKVGDPDAEFLQALRGHFYPDAATENP